MTESSSTTDSPPAVETQPRSVSKAKEIKSALVRVGLKKVSPDILEKCVVLLGAQNLTADQLATHWETFTLNQQQQAQQAAPKTLNEHTYTTFRNFVLKQQQQASEPSSLAGTKRPPQQHLVTPPPGAKRATPSSKPINTPLYRDRPRVGHVVASYQWEDGQSVDVSSSSTKVAIESNPPFSHNVQQAYRFGFTTVEERAQALDDHLTDIGEKLWDNVQNKEEAPLEAIGVPSQDRITCIGRICNEAHEGKLNASSVVLEGARATSGGQRIPIALPSSEEATPYSLYPGQIVALQGLNPTGRKLVVDKVAATDARVPPATTSVRQLKAQQGSVGKTQVWSVCGPYTTSDNLEYEPLMDLVAQILDHSPHVVVLMGPFVDVRHSSVAAGQTQIPTEDDLGEPVTASFEAFFAHQIAGLLEQLVVQQKEQKGIQTQFVLVPSIDDAVAKPVYPQPPLEDRFKVPQILNLPGAEGMEHGTLGLERINQAVNNSKVVHCLSNPCVFQINEVVIAASSNDTLFALSSQEIHSATPVPGPPRMPRLAQQIIHQESFCPVFPPPTGWSLDWKFAQNWKLSCRPDILLTPSRLTPFCHVADDVVLVNPGHLTKGTTGGTYAIMEIDPFPSQVLEEHVLDDDTTELTHRLPERTHVQIKRI